MPPAPHDLWLFFPLGLALSIALELPVLLVGLSRRHSPRRRVLAAIWLTSCTYPIVFLVLPELIWRPLGPRGELPYVIVAETFAPLAECLLFWWAYIRKANDRDAALSGESRLGTAKDMAAIIAANLCSFLLGGYLLESLLRWAQVS